MVRVTRSALASAPGYFLQVRGRPPLFVTPDQAAALHWALEELASEPDLQFAEWSAPAGPAELGLEVDP